MTHLLIHCLDEMVSAYVMVSVIQHKCAWCIYVHGTAFVSMRDADSVFQYSKLGTLCEAI